MKKFLIMPAFLMICSLCFSQNNSVGITLSGMSYDNEPGYHISTNIRSQLTHRFGWTTELAFGQIGGTQEKIELVEFIDFSGKISSTEIRSTSSDRFMSFKTGAAIKALEYNKLSLETIFSGGIIRNQKNYFGLLSGEVFLSTPLSQTMVVGFIGGCNFVTWEREWFCTAGVSLRYHM